MSKKLILLLNAVCMILCLSACGMMQTEDYTTNSSSESQTDNIAQQDNASDTFVTEVKTAIQGTINSDKETIVAVVLEKRELRVTVDLSKANPAPLTIEDLAISRTSSITDAILEITNYDDQWDKITIDFVDIGKITNNKDDVIENEFGGRYFPFENLTLK